MKYQYIYGRTETGYRVIKSNDNSKYTNDSKVEKALHLQVVSPENCQNNLLPEPIIFINNISDKKNAVIGKYKIVNDARDNIMCHFYIFDGIDKKKLYENLDSFFSMENFAINLEDAKVFDINKNIKFDNVITEKPKDILKYFEIKENVFKALIVALFDSSPTNKEIYFINKISDKDTVLHNKDLVLTMYSFLPKYIIQNLGFITYFKYITPSNQDTLNSNIKLRFVENNVENTNQYSEKEIKGNYVFDLTNNHCTKNKDVINENLFLDFLYDNLEDYTLNSKMLDFYNYISTALENVDNICFEIISSLYTFWLYKKESKGIDFKELKSLLKYFNLFTESTKIEFVSYLRSNYKSLKEISGTTTDYNKFLLDIYNNIELLRENVIADFSLQISNDALIESYTTLDALGYKNASQLFISSLRKTLLSERIYIDGGIFLIEKSLKDLSKKENKKDIVINIVSLFEQFANISTNIFENINVNHYIGDFILEPLKISNIETFEIYIKKLNFIINKIDDKGGKINFEKIYIITSIIYLKLNMEEVKNESKDVVVDSFFKILNVISENKIILANSDFINYFSEFFTEVFKNVYEDKKLDKLLYFLDMVNTFAENYLEAKSLLFHSSQILKVSLYNVEILDKSEIQEMSFWRESYIKQTENNYIIQTIFEYKKIEELKEILNENNFSEIQEFFSTSLDKTYSKKLHDNIMKETLDWLNEEEKIFKNKSDYNVLYFVFKEDLVKSIEYLPENNIDIWLEYIQFMTTKSNRNFIIDDVIERAIRNNKQLYTQYKKLPTTKQNILFIESTTIEYNMNIEKEKTYSEKIKSLLYVGITLIIYILNVIINNSFGLKNVFLTAGINIFTAGIFISFLIISITKKREILNISVLVITVLSTIINFVVIVKESTSSDMETLNAYKKIYKIRYDFEGPVITIVSTDIIDPKTNTVVNVKGSEIEVQNDKQFSLKYDIQDKISTVDKKTFILKEGDEIIDDFGNVSDTIILDMSKYSLGLKKLEITCYDSFSNKSTEMIILNNIKPPVIEKIKLSIETNKTTDASEASTKNEFITDSTLTLKKNEKLNIKVSIDSAKPIEIWFKINEVEKKLTLADGKYVGDFTKENFLDGENNLIVTVKSSDDRKTINLKLNLVENDSLE